MKIRLDPIGRPMSLALDAIRFAAAALVLLHHAAFAKFGGVLPWRLSQTGIEPVMAFFVLSGFVIAYAAETRDPDAREFALSRLARLLSVTLPALALTAALDRVGAGVFPALYADSWRDAATQANLAVAPAARFAASGVFLNQIWTWNLWPGTDSPFWSLGYEAIYYAIFACAYYGRTGRERAFGVALVCLLAGPKILLLAPVWFTGVAAWGVYKRLSVSAVAGALAATAAIVAYAIFIASGARAALDGWSETLLAGAPAGLIGMSNHFPSNFISGALFAVVIVSLKGLGSGLAPALEVAARPIRAAAACTFSMYLFHAPLIHFFRAVAFAVGGEGLATRSWRVSAIVLVGTMTSTVVLARLTEAKKSEARALLAAAMAALRPSRLGGASRPKLS
jgi:peptidoglycan/LPS O-acetylase OafA/YrhL